MGESRVLVVEDDETISDLVATQLERAGYTVFVAYDGESGLEQAARARPHAIVLDIGLPGLDGLGVLERLKADPHLKSVPVLMLTARHVRQDAEQALKLGAHGYLSKPFDATSFLHRIARLVEVAKAGKNGDEP